jgi:hypothetical protein
VENSIMKNLINSFWSIQAPSYFPDEDPLIVNPEEDDDEEEDDDDDDDGNGGDEEEAEEDKDEDDDDKDVKDKGGKEEELTLARVDYGQIKEKYPQFFKDFPDLKHAFFREQQFTEIFPTVEDAKRAADSELAYEELRTAVIDGDAEKFITELTSESKEGLEAFAKNFFPSLQKENKDLYFDTVAPVVQGFIKRVYGHGAREKDNNVQNAAKIVHKLLFGGDYSDIEKDVPEVLTRGAKDREPDKVDKDKESYFAQKYQGLYREVTDSCYNSLDAEIGKGLEDLKKTRPGLHKIIAKDIRERVLSDMDKDKTYLGRMQSLWAREKRAGFNGQLKSSFNTTFLAKAKALVPKYRSEVRREVLGKELNGGKINGDKEREPNRLTGDRSSHSSSKGKMTVERAKKENLSTRQIFDA